MAERPTGTVTFLFTDIEGSTRLWEEHHYEMRAALERHDEILRSAIEGRGGYVFSTAGDAFAAAFARAGEAVDAAVVAQRDLCAEEWPASTPIRVRMGLHTGEAQERGGDFFGPEVNRAARIMAAGHGGQVLVGGSTAGVVEGVTLVDLGEHRLKDLATVERLFQVSAPGLGSEFGALRTVDGVPGNLPAQTTSFVGRESEVNELVELVRAHPLVTLTGVGGVGKTRLAVQTAAELVPEFPDGVWLVELAPVGDPAALPDVVATALGVTSQAGMSVMDSVAQALSGRRLLIVLDNCEHVLDAAADVADTILAGASTVQVIATSREGLRVGAEHLWPVPSLGLGAGKASAAVKLFVERARAVNPGFSLDDTSDAVSEICARLDGIALAIELAAARMVSMSAEEVRDRLGDRFRLLSGARRGLERHQTLHHAVSWSYDLLDDAEKTTLDRCSVFADGFDLLAAVHLSDGVDEYDVLDRLDSLVRKSLVTAEQARGVTRYGMLETIRQFAEDRLVASGMIDQIRDRHATYFADQATAHWELWNGPDQLVALDWVDANLANLRIAFRWAADGGNLHAATAIAAHTSSLGWGMNRLEPVGWAEEILEAATAAQVPQLPRLYGAASLCTYTGHPERALSHAETGVALEADRRYEPFDIWWSRELEMSANVGVGELDRVLEIAAGLMTQPHPAHVWGQVQTLYLLRSVGRAAEAMDIADETLAAARALGNPFLIATCLAAYGRVFAEADPKRAVAAWHEGLDYSRKHRASLWETVIARDFAGLEADHGDINTALDLAQTSIDSSSRAGNIANIAMALANLAVFFDRLEQPAAAATLYGSATRHPIINAVASLPTTVEHLKVVLGETVFDEAAAAGANMDLSEAVRYAQQQIQQVRGKP